jgi:hypothetical protein
LTKYSHFKFEIVTSFFDLWQEKPIITSAPNKKEKLTADNFDKFI